MKLKKPKKPKKPKKKKSRSKGRIGDLNRPSSARKEPCPDGVDPVMFETYQLVNNKRDKTHRLRSLAFRKLPPQEEWPEYYQQIKIPIDMSMIHERLISNQYSTWQCVSWRGGV